MILFLLGVFVGAIIGVFGLALVTVERLRRDDEKDQQ